jgi:(1->4)-alpha-D-glucan 1-alpha-D-glucosylmutase
VPVTGPAADHAVAFTRGDAVAVVVPRLPLRLADRGGWGDTAIELPAVRWRNQLTGEVTSGGSVVADSLLRRFPVALLEREESP